MDDFLGVVVNSGGIVFEGESVAKIRIDFTSDDSCDIDLIENLSALCGFLHSFRPPSVVISRPNFMADLMNYERDLSGITHSGDCPAVEVNHLCSRIAIPRIASCLRSGSIVKFPVTCLIPVRKVVHANVIELIIKIHRITAENPKTAVKYKSSVKDN